MKDSHKTRTKWNGDNGRGRSRKKDSVKGERKQDGEIIRRDEEYLRERNMDKEIWGSWRRNELTRRGEDR